MVDRIQVSGELDLKIASTRRDASNRKVSHRDSIMDNQKKMRKLSVVAVGGRVASIVRTA